MKKYLYMSTKELDTYNHYLEPYYNSIYMRTIDSDPLTREQVRQIIGYDSFSACIKYNRLVELWDLVYSKALDLITKDQCRYLRTPIYAVYNNKELYHMEAGIEEFISRFEVQKENKND